LISLKLSDQLIDLKINRLI